MTDGRQDSADYGPVAEWPREKLEEHRDMLNQRKADIEGRIDAINSILEDRNNG